jgi:caffeoyl-CoA O-methyltransferase
MKKKKNSNRYILEHIEPEDPVLQELSRETHLESSGGKMISGSSAGAGTYHVFKNDSA